MCAFKQEDVDPQTPDEKSQEERRTPEAYPDFVANSNDPKRPTNEFVLVSVARMCLSLCL
jgi:hypothetical protein